jgi:hypothetical protein
MIKFLALFSIDKKFDIIYKNFLINTIDDFKN